MTTYSFSQLESLWTSAGGSSTLAPVMAAIALAESGGNPDAVNGETDATGLWQINLDAGNGVYVPGGAGNATNPAANAKAAVSIEQAQGLSAWTTYTSGAYEQYMPGGSAYTGASSGSSATTDASILGISLPGWSDLTGFASDADAFITAAMWIMKPSSWVRIGAGFIGLILLMFAIYAFMRVANGDSIMPKSPVSAGDAIGLAAMAA